MRRSVLNSLLYFPERELLESPSARGLSFEELAIATDDGERLHGWWVPATSKRLSSILLCHGNGGNVGDRVRHAELLCGAGFDVLLFDYRGYGRSTGRPDEDGTYRDARAAREALLAEAGEEPVVMGESLGGGVALDLALEHPPRGLVLQSAFSSVRDMARHHYPYLPGPLVPDVYPSLGRIAGLRAPLLVLHGERDEIVPSSHGRALHAAAPEPKRLRLFPDVGHNDFVEAEGYAEAIAGWAESELR
ncbi:MAG TPA: alpha/beta hydrolase [Thermoleophilaceae bacterium]|nr:alpha/beta hydrolase [Thermoleophilaceae bacterium]